MELEQHTLSSLERNIEQQQRCFSLEEARQSSSPLSAAFFTATMSSAEEVEEALETVSGQTHESFTKLFLFHFIYVLWNNITHYI